MRRDPFKVLGLEPGASAEEIKRAFHEKARSVHPDRADSLPPTERRLAREEFDELQDAYHALSRRPSRPPPSTAPGVQDLLATGSGGPATWLAGLEQRLAEIEPDLGWEVQKETYGYFDKVVQAKDSSRRHLLLVKRFRELHPRDLPGIEEHADQMRAMPDFGLVCSQYTYLLLAERVTAPEKFRELATAFNRRSFAELPPRSPLALIAYRTTGGLTAEHPGVEDPVLDLSALLAPTGESSPPPVDEEQVRAPITLPPPAPGAGSTTILVVDGDRFQSGEVSVVLRGQGYRVLQADSVLAARRILLEEEIDLVVLEDDLPGVHGIELLRYLELSSGTSREPAVLMYSDRNPAMLAPHMRYERVVGFQPKGRGTAAFLRSLTTALQATKTSG